MQIRALPISEWSTGEVCGHVCSRGSRDRRVSGICVVSTLAVCMRSSRVGLSACVSFLPLELGFGRRVFPFHFFLVVTVLLLFLCFVSVGDMGREQRQRRLHRPEHHPDLRRERSVPDRAAHARCCPHRTVVRVCRGHHVHDAHCARSVHTMEGHLPTDRRIRSSLNA